MNAPLVYLVSAAYAAALKRVGWIGRTPAYFVIGFTVVAALLVANGRLLLPLAVPAIPYTFPYWLGVLVVASIGNARRMRAGQERGSDIDVTTFRDCVRVPTMLPSSAERGRA